MTSITNGSPAPTSAAAQDFHWEVQPAAQALVRELVHDFLDRCPEANGLTRRMHDETGTRFIDWVQLISVRPDPGLQARLLEVGFEHVALGDTPECYGHPGGMFPNVMFCPESPFCLLIKVDSVADFMAAHGLADHAVEGEPFARVRVGLVARSERAEFWVIERHGVAGYPWPATIPTDAALNVRAQRHFERLRTRRRKFASIEEGFAYTNGLLDEVIADLGRDWTCDLFFYAEREHWQRRNRAAQVQKARQDRLGLGWANHDHHTYRSSREAFHHLIALFEKLGFRCRERFYAGAEAGWGAQVIEQPIAGITIFADVDMSPEELMGDFAHGGLQARQELGTVGLWCALHGEAIFEAGMHHLECQFDWHALKDQLEKEAGIKTMDPFTTFPFLRQAFTEGERWPVAEERIARLLERGQITREQAAQFRQHGAIGSHLENLERNEGYKGFNQTGVSQIIATTDPRRQQPQPAGA